MTEQQLANRAWLLEHRRWLRVVEMIHTHRIMFREWAWLYWDLDRSA
jgi:hypothetical protein